MMVIIMDEENGIVTALHLKDQFIWHSLNTVPYNLLLT